MVSTDCYFAASDSCTALLGGVKNLRYHGGNEAVFSGIKKERASNTLVFAMMNDAKRDTMLAKALFSHFVASFEVPKGAALTKFSISFIDEAAGDVLNYRCERMTDIAAVIDEEDGQHRCCSLQVSVIEPTGRSFTFSGARLTLMIWSKAGDNGTLVHAAEHVGLVLKTRITSVCVYFVTGDPSFIESSLSLAYDLCKVCRTTVFGENEKVKPQALIEDIRAWSLYLNEFYHFSPHSEGPYFINLNPQLTVGEKLAHAISKGVSYILAEPENASCVDIIVFPLPESTEGNNDHRSIYSPHCRVKYDENGAVYIRPECGMTYVNGKLLSTEILLNHNDRIVLGNEIMFRFVVVTSTPRVTTAATGSQILDWEMSCREFDSKTLCTIRQTECNRLQEEVNELKKECERLEVEMQLERGVNDKAWLVLNNPPDDYTATFVWHLGWMKTGDFITLGPEGDIALPFLSDISVITRTGSGFTYHSDDAGTLKLAHSHRFANGSGIFSLCVKADENSESNYFYKKETVAAKELRPCTEGDLRGLRNALFELQWSVALLFDFAFPLERRGADGDGGDPHNVRRAQLSGDAILTEMVLDLRDVTNLTGNMTEAVRMIACQMADVVRNGASAADTDTAGGTVELMGSGRCVTVLDLLNRINKETRLSHEVLLQVQQSVGRALIESAENGKHSRVTGFPHTSSKDMNSSLSIKLRNHLEMLKAKCFIASPSAVRHMHSTMESISVSSRPKAVLERYIKVLKTMAKPNLDLSTVSVVQKQNLAGALLDVIIALDYNIMKGCLSQKEEESMEEHLPLWMAVGDTCLEVLKRVERKGPVDSRSRSAALQQKTTSTNRHSSPATRSVAKKLLSRPGTPHGGGGGGVNTTAAFSSPRFNQKASPLNMDAKKKTVLRGKSPFGLRAATPTGLSTRSAVKPMSAKSNPVVSPRAGERGRVILTSGSTTSSSISRLLRKTSAIDAARTTPCTKTGAISPKSTRLRNKYSSTMVFKK